MSAYAELHCLSNFSFLRGASQPEELVEQAAELGYQALALTDECSLAGIVRAHQRARKCGLKLIIGAEIQVLNGPKVVLLAPSKGGYSQLCRLLTHGRRAAAKGEYQLTRANLSRDLDQCLAILLPQAAPASVACVEDGEWLAEAFAGRAWLGVELHCGPDDERRLAELRALAGRCALPLVACGDVHMHRRERRPLQDTLTAIRHGCAVQDAGLRLFPNGERHLRSLARLAQIYPPELLAESCAIAARCAFSLAELRYQYPAESVPPERTAAQHLRALTEAGLRKRWPTGASRRVRALVEKELSLIQELGYEHYFLTVHEIVSWARGQGILCQGRGSAANSSVCFCLGITSVDPSQMNMLFERFVSRERNEPPDIDVDFEHERREDVIQHIYRKYGRHRAALAATLICYRPKSAIRDVGKALGLSLDDVDRISKSLAWWDEADGFRERLAEQGFEPDSPVMQRFLSLVRQIQGVPRHLSQHVGGFVISAGPLHELVPIENAAMADRTVIQWDKDDLDAIGLLKIDCLGLGMLTAIRKSFDLIQGHSGHRLSIDKIRDTERDQPDAAGEVYAMLQAADSVGVFQVESRAQMSMLPRLRPARFYDLVIEVAIVRPGPIQGGMVHPYLNRRQGREPVHCPAGLEPILARTLGVPIFQEQVMEICIAAGGFTPGEADEVRRSMAAWKRAGGLEHLEQRLKKGMAQRGYPDSFADQIYQQILGFGEYGFPESHAASFALLVYVSAWLRRFEPAAFLAGLLNSQPMGFYSASQLIQDARRNRYCPVEVLAADVMHSQWEAQLEKRSAGPPAVRLGLNRIKGLGAELARRIVSQRPFHDVGDLVRRAKLNGRDRELLARADALRSLAGHRHNAHWHSQGLLAPAPLLANHSPLEPTPPLRPPREGEEICADYASLGFSLRRHPLALLRPRLDKLQALTAERWRATRNGRRCQVVGLVTNRQRPGTAGGIIFMTLEDETGTINLIIRNEILQNYRATVLQARMVLAQGTMENRDQVQHLMVQSLEDLTPLLGRLPTGSRDFH